MSSLWTKPFLVESAVAQIISKQAVHGCNFNRRKAQFGIHCLNEMIVNIDKELVPQLPMMMNKGTSYAKPFLKSGGFSKYSGIYCDKMGIPREEVSGPFTMLWYTPFDTSKIERLKYVMVDLGWRPALWNFKKNPLEDLRGMPPEVRSIQENLILEKYITKNILGHGKAYTELLLAQYRYGKRTRTVGMLKDFLRKERFWYSGPKITPDEDEFKGDDKILGLIRNRMIWSHRRSLLQGLVKNVRPDGKVPGEANPDATPTHRMKHKVIVNIPAGRAPYGHLCRSLFMGDYDKTVIKPIIYRKELVEGKVRKKHGTNLLEEFDSKKGKWKICGTYRILIPKGQQSFVGYDGAGLELRMLAHYLESTARFMVASAAKSRDPKKVKQADYVLKSALAYKAQILDGDIHSHNQGLAGLPTRDSAKTFIYAFLYGAGDAKIGTIVGGGAKEGKDIKETFFAACPAIKVLIEHVQKAAASGTLKGLDGRILQMRRDYEGKPMTHKALNTLLQAAGAIVMKYSMVILNNQVKKMGLRANKVLDVHDEGQWSCHGEDVAPLRSCMNDCLRRAGEYLNMCCPLASDSIVGLSWLHTH